MKNITIILVLTLFLAVSADAQRTADFRRLSLENGTAAQKSWLISDQSSLGINENGTLTGTFPNTNAMLTLGAGTKGNALDIQSLVGGTGILFSQNIPSVGIDMLLGASGTGIIIDGGTPVGITIGNATAGSDGMTVDATNSGISIGNGTAPNNGMNIEATSTGLSIGAATTPDIGQTTDANITGATFDAGIIGVDIGQSSNPSLGLGVSNAFQGIDVQNSFIGIGINNVFGGLSITNSLFSIQTDAEQTFGDGFGTDNTTFNIGSGSVTINGITDNVLVVNGTADATGANVGGDPVWDARINGDLHVSGIIKMGGSIYIDGTTPNNHSILANDDLTIGTNAPGQNFNLVAGLGGIINITAPIMFPALPSLSNLDMGNFRILNIGNAGTDFTAAGGLTLAHQLTVGNIPALSTSLNVLVTNAGVLEQRTAASIIAATAWALGGNTAPSSNIFGTLSATDVLMQAGGATQMTIRAAGGINVPGQIDAGGTISNGALGGSGLVLNDDVLIQGIAHHNGVTNLNNQNELRFKELSVNGGNHISFRAPTSLAGDISYTLPALDAAGVLTSNGAGALSWSASSAGWGLTGNALTGGTPATPNEWFGSSNTYDVIFRSNNTERMRIASGGNVGIGSTSPFTQLTMPGQVPSGSVGSVGTNAGPTGIAVSGRYAYVTTQSGSLQVIDISNPASMVVEGTLAGLGGIPRQLFASGRYAYVANEGAGSLQIIDVGNPAAPVLAGSIAAASCNSVHVVGRYAYVTSYSGNVLRIIDVSNPTSPVQLSTVGTGLSPSYVNVNGKYAFVTAEGSSRLECYDVSNPTAPTLVSTIGTGMTNPYSVNVSDKYAYVADWSGSFFVVDVSDPAAMSVVGNIGGLGSPYYVHSSGRYVYVVATGGTMRVIDVSNPASPTSLGTSTTGAFPFAVYSAGRYVYVCNRSSNTVTAHDMGGAYVQTLETGNLEAARIQVRNDINVNGDIAVKGGIVAGTAEFHGGVGIATGGFKVATGSVTVVANAATINAAQYSAVNITSDNNGTNDVVTINGGVEGQTLFIYYNHTALNDDIILAGSTVVVNNASAAGITMCYIGGAWRVVGSYLY